MLLAYQINMCAFIGHNLRLINIGLCYHKPEVYILNYYFKVIKLFLLTVTSINMPHISQLYSPLESAQRAHYLQTKWSNSKVKT